MNLINCSIEKIYIHFVGNKLRGEKILSSDEAINMSDDTEYLVTQYFLSPFKIKEYQKFTHNSELQLNEVFSYISKIFSNNAELGEQSSNLAKHLYKNSTHPNIKGGEFYTVYFKNCLINGKNVDAIGLFKSENKDTFLKVEREEQQFNIYSDKGININNLDKGCLIFNIDAEDGYWVSIVDKSGKGSEAQYWKEDFLGVKPKNDDFAQTQHFMATCKQFITNELANKGLPLIEQADLLNKSMEFFKAHKQFETDKFNKEVFAEKRNLAHLFDDYKKEEENSSDLFIPSTFAISDVAVKKQVRSYKKIIRLDEAVDIHLLNDEHHIEQGEDKQGKFYKIYFKKEK